jgi:hypothetical protein
MATWEQAQAAAEAAGLSGECRTQFLIDKTDWGKNPQIRHTRTEEGSAKLRATAATHVGGCEGCRRAEQALGG